MEAKIATKSNLFKDYKIENLNIRNLKDFVQPSLRFESEIRKKLGYMGNNIECEKQLNEAPQYIIENNKYEEYLRLKHREFVLIYYEVM